MSICIYDNIIIGGGIAGLYMAYKLKKANEKFILIEKNEIIGGRAIHKPFHGANVSSGAGVGRKDTNPILIKLCNELKIDIKESKAIIEYKLEEKCDVLEIFKFLKQKYLTNPEYYNTITFRKFGEKILGSKLYELFVISNGYSDFEDADVYDTLFHYGIEDNVSGWDKLFINWTELINKLGDSIGYENIKLSTQVKKINRNNLFELETDKTINYYGKKIIIATTANITQQLLPEHTILKQIHSQKFLRIYAKLNKKICEKYTVVNGVLQKIIPIKDNIFMIAYADNKKAMILDKILNSCYAKRILEKLLEYTFDTRYIKILDSLYFYWDEGTHYYEPMNNQFKLREDFIKKCQYPEKNIFVIGEMVSLLQGWVEGALQSVECLFTKNTKIN